MTRPKRNDGEILEPIARKLPEGEYLASHVAPVFGRGKSRILQLCKRFKIGRACDPLQTGQAAVLLSKNNLIQLARYFDKCGKRQRHAPWREKLESESQQPAKTVKPAIRSPKKREK